jgi:transposase-like protein
MRKERKHFTPEEKVAILRRHVVDKVPVSEVCEELGLRPTVSYRGAFLPRGSFWVPQR